MHVVNWKVGRLEMFKKFYGLSDPTATIFSSDPDYYPLAENLFYLHCDQEKADVIIKFKGVKSED